MDSVNVMLIVGLIAAALVAVVLAFTNNSNVVKRNQALKEKEDLAKQLKELKADLQKVQGDNATRGEAAQDNKEKLEKSRRKNNDLNKEIDSLKADLKAQKEQYEARDEEVKGVYAHLEKLSSEKAELAAKVQDLSAQINKNNARKAEKVSDKEAADEVVAPKNNVVVDKNPELERKIAALQQDVAALKEKNKALAEERNEFKRSAGRLERRVDDLRHADAVAQGKVTLAEDKLHDLERRYYDAVSELAVVKGQVKA